MKKFVKALLLTVVLFACDSVFALEIYSNNIVMYQLNDDKVVYQMRKDDRVSIASMTKVMTTIVAIEHISDVNDTLVITDEMFSGLYEEGASLAGFHVGQQVTYLDLLYGAMLPSGAEATRALALTIAGSEDAFVEMMNEKAIALGLSNTHFVNTTGLDVYGHYSTVDDVAHIFMYALKNPLFYDIISNRSYTISDGSLTFSSTIARYTDRYDLSLPYLIGGKTGFTLDAGYCLVSVAKKDGITYLVASAGVPADSSYPYHVLDAQTLYEFFYENYGYQKVVSKDLEVGSIPVKYGKVDQVLVSIPEDKVYYLENDYQDAVRFETDFISEVTYRMKRGERLGTYSIYYNDELLDEIVLTLNEDMHFSILSYFKVNWKWICGVGSVLILVIVFLVHKVRHS